MIDLVRRIVAPLATRVSNMVGRAVVRAVNDGAKVQLLQLELLSGEIRDEVERFQNYGFTSRPRDGAEAAVIFVGGRREHGLVVGVDDRRSRLTNLEPGEVATYSDSGATITLKANGDVEVTPKSGQKLKIAADVEVTGTLTASSDVVGGGKSLKNHTHASGTLTSPSGAVTGSTGAPT